MTQKLEIGNAEIGAPTLGEGPPPKKSVVLDAAALATGRATATSPEVKQVATNRTMAQPTRPK